jgi:K+-transporting ATPase KdpF subunit
VTPLEVAAAALAFALSLYLLVALLRPDRF